MNRQLSVLYAVMGMLAQTLFCTSVAGADPGNLYNADFLPGNTRELLEQRRQQNQSDSTAPQPGNGSNLYNSDFLPDGVLEQLERARNPNSAGSTSDVRQQVYDGIFDNNNSQPAPTPSSRSSDKTLEAINSATRLLEMLQSSKPQPQNNAPANSPPRNAAPDNSQYTAPLNQRSYDENVRYTQPPNTPSRKAAIPASPPAPPACPAGTQKNVEMEALGLASCCDSEGQCF